MKNILYRKDTPYPALEPLERQKVLITGADGWIGRHLVPALAEKHDLRLMVIDAEADSAKTIAAYGEIVECRLEDLDGLRSITQGIDTVVHLAAVVDYNAAWKPLLDINIIGTYNMVVAAKAADCRRIILASSVHSVIAYPNDFEVETDMPIRPGTVYGVTKVFKEALGSYIAVREGLSSIVIRIGGYGDKDRITQNTNPIPLSFFFSKEDMNQLVDLCIDDVDLHFAVVNGISDNKHKRLALVDTREALGYEPEHDSFALSEHWDGKAPPANYHFAQPIDPEYSGLRDDLKTPGS